MLLPFTFRQNFVAQAVGVSIIAHAAFFAAVPWASSTKVSVQQGLDSVQVIILEEKKPDPVTNQIRSDEAAGPARSEAKKLKPHHKSASVVAISSTGSISEAIPDSSANPAPVYPRLARERGWEGLVVLKVHVMKDGTVNQVLVNDSSGHAILDDSAKQAVQKWRFIPSRIGPISFDSWVRVPIHFLLKKSK